MLLSGCRREGRAVGKKIDVSIEKKGVVVARRPQPTPFRVESDECAAAQARTLGITEALTK